MSIAGIRSSRGDSYQTLVAFDWALSVLTNEDYQWIEIDSVALLVDDVVIGKSDGTKICCQCKKNETDCTAWTIAGLADELNKAKGLLVDDPTAEVRFYSRSPFGTLAKLREHCTTQPDDASYRGSLGKEHRETDAKLGILLAGAPDLSTYEFLRRTTFEITREIDRMEILLRERLQYVASNPRAAYDALWRCLDQLGARIGSEGRATTKHRLTKDDLKTLLHQAGAMLVPIIALAEVRTAFAGISAIGRTWQRDIAGLRITNPVVFELLALIEARTRAILLTGLPGSGKTCALLDVQEALELLAVTRTGLVPLFIQSREFADAGTAQDRLALGLPEQWVEKVARMAEEAHVIIVFDSLDVLSIAREHSVLTYFLAQIDRLLRVPNVTVVTACRDFDRRYDRRIAVREWDGEVKCAALDWEVTVVPLLQKLDIDPKDIDAVTQDVIRNPRELALFVELAKQNGSFNVVTSHALAQRYLSVVVRSNPALGDEAMQAIESIADEMLKRRNLSVPNQRFPASQEIQRVLLSHNILHETRDEKLTFGHQTLLDALVISGALRKGFTLAEFIKDLPAVPFVRPSIRSFVAQLATGERREFRTQLRAVLTGNFAFHIRRLVAESFAEQLPQDGDWALIRDLCVKHREVFQVIYTQANAIAWHHFWLKHLVPFLNETRDSHGIATHAHRISQWKNQDSESVLAFWAAVLAVDWVDGNQIAEQLAGYLLAIQVKDLTTLSPLLISLLNMPRQESSFLGRAVARCVTGGAADSALVWRYVAGDICDNDALEFGFGKKLHSQAYEFGDRNENFLLQQMKQSTALLDLAIQSVERWSHLRISNIGIWMAGRMGFLEHTSYDDFHSQRGFKHIDNERVLMDAMQAAILHHAEINEDWWDTNRERLCFSDECALRYFAILACTAYPAGNIDVIARLLRNTDFLNSDLSHEMGTLIQASFMLLSAQQQEAVMGAILADWGKTDLDASHRFWRLQAQAKLIVTIPCYLRPAHVQAVLELYEKSEGTLVRQPEIGTRGGMVNAPFSFEVFLIAEDAEVTRLLTHYTGHSEMHTVDFMVGGERDVGSQLREAASRDPVRFLHLLSERWPAISEGFRNDILDGVANYLAHRYGNLQPSGAWAPINEPDATALAQHVLDELERHPIHWHHNRAASNALQACAHVIQDAKEAARVAFLAIGFANLREDGFINGDSERLLNRGINLIRGRVVEALMILVNRLQERNIEFPDLLSPTLRRFARDEDPALRVLILRRLPYLQSQNPELGWNLYNLAMHGDAMGLWETAEPCLFYAYHNQFEKVAPLLARLRREGNGKDLETWGRISALAAFTKRIKFSVFLEDLIALNAADAWRGAASVWTHTENIKQHRGECLAGIEAGLSANAPHSSAVAQAMSSIFRRTTPPSSIPTELIKRYFLVLESDKQNNPGDLFGFDKWLNTTSQNKPEEALAASELYLGYARRTRSYLYDHESNLPQFLTRIFAEAEEREALDHGEMLQRVVALQDLMTSMGVNGVNEWLGAAERP